MLRNRKKYWHITAYFVRSCLGEKGNCSKITTMFQMIRQILFVYSLVVSSSKAFQIPSMDFVYGGTITKQLVSAHPVQKFCTPNILLHGQLRIKVNRNCLIHGRSTSLQMAGFFDDIGKFFGQNSEGEEEGENQKNNSDKSNSEFVSSDDEDDEDYYAGTSRIFDIPAESIKIGGLRLYLSLHLMGQQNTPEDKCCKMDQTGQTGIDLYHQDQTGVLMINLSESNISFDRLGSAPSMKYLMHETIILEGVLDTLDEIITDQNIPETDRLLKLKTPGDALQVARDTLSFS